MKLPRRFLAITCLLIPALIGRAANQTWTGGSLINGNWSSTANWSGGAAPGSTTVLNSTDVATFSSALLNGWGTLGTPIVIDSATQNIAGLTFTGAAGSFVIGTTGGNALRLSSAGSIQIASGLTSTGVTQTINAPLALQGTSYSFTNSSALGRGTLVIGGGVTGTTGATTLTLGGTNTGENTVSGSIGNGTATSVAVTKSGAGTWVLSGLNSYTGVTTVSAGVLNLRHGSALGNVAGGTSVTSGAALQLQGGITTLAEALTLNGRGISSTGALRNVSGDNTYAGLLTLGSATRINSDAGTLTLSHSGTITGTFGLTVGGAGNTTIQSIIGTSTGTLTKDGSGTLLLSRANTYTGATTVNEGTLRAGVSNSFGSNSDVTLANVAGVTLDLNGFNTQIGSLSGGGNSGGNVTLGGATLTIMGFPTTQPFAGVISGTGGLTRTGGARTILTGANTYTGATTVTSGTLQLGNGGTTGSLAPSSAISIASGNTLTFNRSNAVTQGTDFAAVISSGAGGVTQNGPGTLTLSGANAYTGRTTVNGGSLVLAFGTVSSNIISASSPLSLGGGTLQLTGNGTQTFAGLTTTADTGSRILMGASETLTLGALTSAGAASALNFNTAAGGADGATVGSSLITLTGGTLLNNWTVTDSTGFGLAARNGSNQIIRDTTTTLLPASGATSGTNYRIDNNAGGAAAPGSSTLAITASQAASSITVDTSAGNGAVTLGSGVVLSSNTWNFGGSATSTNTWGISGSAGGAGLQAAASGNAMEINNYATGTVTLTAPILAFGTNAVNIKGTGTTVFAGANTYTGSTTVRGGTLEVSSGGSIAQPAANLVVSANSGENGTLKLTGGSISNLVATLGFSLGSLGTANVSAGTWTSSGSLTVGDSGAGVLNLSGTGAIRNTLGILGGFAGSLGTATVSGGTWTNSSALFVGYNGAGVLNLIGTGAISSAGGTLGSSAGSLGTATVSGGTWTHSAGLTVGSGGTGVLNLSGTAAISNTAATLGTNAGSQGTATVSGGTWTSSGSLTVGDSGTGVLNLSGTGAIRNTSATLGNSAGSLGTANVSGGTWTSSGSLTVGNGGTGVLNLIGTGAISSAGATLGSGAGSLGTANVSGGVWTSSGNLTMGSTGTGVLNLTGGTVHAGGVAGTSTVTLGTNAGSAGTLNLGTGSTAGTLNAATVTGGSGTAVLNFNHTGSLSLAANLTASLVVNKLGAGTTILSGTNTYTGATTITEGTLQIGNGGITGALATGSAISNNGTLAFNRSDTVTQGTHFATVISGSGGVTQLGTGILILSGTNTYTGATAVTGGVLQVNGSTVAASAAGVSGGALGGTGTVNGAVTLSSTGGIKLTDAQVGTLTLGSTLNLTGAVGAHSLSFDLASAGTTTDKLAVSGAVTMTTPGAAVVSLNQINGAANRLTAGTYDLITGSAVPSSGNFTLATTKAFGQSFALTGTATQLQLTTTQSAAGPAAAFWSGAAGVNWSAAGNWNTDAASNTAAGAAPGYESNVTFATTTPVATNLTTNVVDADFDINSLTFNGAAGGVTIGGSKMVTIEATTANGNAAGNGITSSNSSGTNTISAQVGLAANQTWTVASGGTLAVSGAVSDFGGGYTLTKAGTGTLILSGASTYTGTTVISAGVLNLQHGSGLGTPLAGTNVTSGAALQLQGGITTLAEALTLNGTGISSTGALRNLSGDNTYAGLLTLGSATRINSDAGTLTLSHAGTITGAFGLTVGGAGNTTIQSVIGTTTGSLTKEGSGTLTLNGTSTYTGATTVNGGTLRAGVSGALGPNSAVALADVAGVTLDLSGFHTQIGSLTGGGASGGNVTLGTATLIVGGSTFPQPFAGVISGSGGLIRSGSGRLTLTGANTYTGATTISAGTLQLGNGGTTGSLSASSAISIASGGTLVFNRSNAVTQGTDFAAVISSGAGAVMQNGPGTLTLSGANVYTGRTTVNGGSLVLAFGTVSSNIVSPASPLTLGGGTLQLTGTGTQTFAGLTTSNNSGSRIFMGASQTLTLGALTSAGTASSLNFNTAAGGANAATTTVGSSIITLTGGTLLNSWTVTDSTGFGLAARNGSNQIIRDTTTTLLPASGATSGINYRIDNNAGGTAAAGSSTLAITASQAASSITVDTSAGNGAVTLGSGVVLSSSTWNFGGTGSNTWGISGSAGGAGLQAAASGNDIEINNYASGTVTLSAPLLAFGTNRVNFKGTGTTVLAGVNTYTGETTVRGGTLEVPTGGVINHPASNLFLGTINGENGTLKLTGGSISNTNAILGDSAGGLGTANVSGGTWTNSSAIFVGVGGTGVLNLSGTAAISSAGGNLGSAAGSLGTANVSGGTWTSSGNLGVGNSGTGVLNLTGGTVHVGGVAGTGTVFMADNSGSFGTLNLGMGGTAGILNAATVTGGSGTAVVNFNHTGSLSFDKALTGSLAVNKLGTGTTTLSGITNTYSGGTTVSGGILNVTNASGSATGTSSVLVTGSGALGGTGSLSGAVTLSGSGGLDLRDGVVGTLTLTSTLSLTGAAGAHGLSFDLASAGSTTDKIAVTGAVSMTTPGAAVISLNQLGGAANRLTAGTYDLITGSAVPTIGNFSLATTRAFGQTFALTGTATALKLTTTQVTAATPAAFWKGGTNNWSTATNWNSTVAGGAAAGAAPDYQTNVTFATTTPAATNLTTNVLDTDFDINSLTFNAATGGVTIGGTKMLTIEAGTANGNAAGNGITSSNSSGTNTISAQVALAANQTWTVASGGTLAVSGVVSDFGGGYTMTKAGAGTLVLSGANTYSGATTISAGTLQIGNNGATGSLSSLSAITNNGTLLFQRRNTITQGTDFAPVISGTGAVTQNNASGTLVLNGANTYAGLTTVTAGVLNIQHAEALGTNAAGTTVSNNAALQLQGGITTLAEALTLNGTGVGGSGALRNVSGDNTFAGLVTLGSATQINSDAGTLTLSHTGTITGSTFGLTVGGAGNTTIQSIIGTGSGTLTKTGTGMLTLTRQNTYTGATTVNGGTLALAFGTVSSNIISASSPLTLGGGTLQLTGTGTQTFAGLTTTADTGSRILMGASETLTLGALTSAGTASALNFNTAAGGANAATTTVGSSLITLTGGILLNSWTVTDSTGFGLAARNGSNQIIRDTTTTLLPASGATSGINYRIDNNAGGAAAPGSSTLAITASQAASSITVDTSAGNGAVTLGSGVVLSSNTWNFGGTGSNTWGISGSAGGASLQAAASGNTIEINNYASGTVTLSTPILALGTNNVNIKGTGTTVLAGVNTYTGQTNVRGGTLEVPTGGVINHPGNSLFVGSNSGENGTLKITGGSISNTQGILGNSAGGQGTANVSGGTWTNSSALFVGVGGTGVLNLSGTSAVSSGSGFLGSLTGSLGTANVGSGTWTNNGDLRMGISGTGVLNLSGTGAISNTTATLGFNPGGLGTANVSGGTWTSSSSLTLGNSGTGVLNLSGTGAISNLIGFLGQNSGSLGTANVSGGTLTISGALALGNSGTGVLNLSGTGAISNSNATLGGSVGSQGTATVSGGTWTSSLSLTAGSSGTGVLNLSGTGAISNSTAVLGSLAGSSGTATVSGGTWTSGGGLTVGSSGTGVLNLTGGTVHAGGVAGTGTVTLGSAVGSSGTLNLGTGGTVGTLNAATVNGGSGTAVLNFNHTGSLSLAANLTGTLVVNKLGAGTTILSGTNTYTGATTITEGTLQIGSGGITGALATSSAISNNGTLAFNRSDTVTQGTHFASVISGSGGVTQLGTGILILSGTNTYTGATAVTGGVLQVTGSTAAASAVGVSGGALGGTGTVNGAVTLSSTGGIKLTDAAVGTLTLGSTLNLTGAAGAHPLSFDLASAGTTTDKIAVSGAVTMTTPGAAVVSLNQIGGAASRLTAGTYDLITGSAVPSSGNFTLATTKAFGQSFALTGTATQLQLTTTQSAAGPAAAFWSGAAGVNWSAAGNWNTNAASNTAAGAAPGYQSNVTFATTTPSAMNLTTNVVDADFDINSLTFNGAAGGVTIGGSKMLTIEATAANGNAAGNGITSSNSSGTNTISSPVGLAASQTWTVATGGTLAVSGVVSDFGGGYTLTKAGTGTLILSGASTYTGTTTISAGVLNLQNGSGLGTPLAGTSVTSGAALQLQGGITTLAEALTLNGAGISSTGALRNLSGDNTYAGLLTLGGNTRINSDAGTLTLSHSGTITGTFGLTVGGAGNTTIQSIIGTSTGTLTKDGTGTLTLSGVSTYTGATTVNGGTLKAGVSGALGPNSAVTLADVAGVTLDLSGFSTQIGSLTGGGASGGNVTLGTATLTVGSTTTPQPYAGVISGSGGLTRSGSGTLILTGANTYTGATTISAGILQLGNGGTTGSLSASSALSIASGATLVFNRSNAVTQGTDFAAAISSGAGAVTQNGPGTLTLSGANVYTGRTTVNGGSLVLAFGTVSSNIISAASPLTLGGGTLQLTGTGTQTFAGLTTSVGTGSRILMGASETLTLGALTSAGFGSALNFNTAAGGANAATATVGSSIITLTGGTLLNSWTVTDSTGFGLAARNGSNQIIRNTTTTLLPASGATSGINYLIDNNAGGTAAPGSSTLAITASQAASSITVDTSAGNGAVTLGSGVVLSSNTWNFGGTGSNTWGISGSAGGAGLRAAASGNTIEINNYASGTVTLSAPILALGTNNVNFKGTGTTVLAGANTYTGQTIVRGGTLEVPTGGVINHPAQSLIVGNVSGDNGTLKLTGGSISNDTAALGSGTGSLGTANVSSGTWTSSGALTVGSNGTGVLNLSGTGAISNTTATLGSQAGSLGTATVSGGTWTSSSTLTVGSSGTGVLNLTAGTVSNASGSVGGNAGSSGTANISGGSWTNSGTLNIGSASGSGTGVLNLSGSGSVSSVMVLLGNAAGSLGTANVSGGSWAIGSSGFNIGNNGTGVLNLSGSGEVISSAAGFIVGINAGSSGTANLTGGTLHVGGVGGTGTVTLGSVAGSSGTLNLGTGGTAGILNAATVTGGSGTALVNFNHTGSLAFDKALTGTLAVNKLGAGTTTLSATTNTYTGGTTVSDGTLNLINASGSATGTGSLLVTSTGTLSGTGALNAGANAITLNGTLTIGDTTLGSPVVSSLTLGTTSGTGITLGATGSMIFDLFSRGGPSGDNTAIPTASDLLILTGDISINPAAQLLINNPTGMSGFAIGDKWKLWNVAGAGTITGNFTLANIIAPALSGGDKAWAFNSANGVLSIVPEPSRAILMMLGLLGVIMRRRR